jgi:hypothetical protein
VVWALVPLEAEEEWGLVVAMQVPCDAEKERGGVVAGQVGWEPQFETLCFPP